MFIHDRFPGDDDGTIIRDQSLKDCLTYSVMVSAQRVNKQKIKKNRKHTHRIWLSNDMVACASCAHACCWVKDYFMRARLSD